MGRHSFQIVKYGLCDISSENRSFDDIMIKFANSKISDVRTSVLSHTKNHESFAKLLILFFDITKAGSFISPFMPSVMSLIFQNCHDITEFSVTEKIATLKYNHELTIPQN